MNLRPVRFAEACEFIALHHRHHKPSQGWLFGIGAEEAGKLIGVVTVGRPVARAIDDGYTAEVTRCCTDGTPHACSKLYAAAWRAARAMGYRRLLTYVLKSESGGSLKASGWKCVGQTRGGSWTCPSRPREDMHPLERKVRWEIELPLPLPAPCRDGVAGESKHND